MRTDRELLQSALDALNLINHRGNTDDELMQVGQTITQIQERLAEPEDEPVAWMDDKGYTVSASKTHPNEKYPRFPIPLYRHPPRQPVRLSDEEILAIAEKYGTFETRLRPLYNYDGSPTGEVYKQVDWDIGQEDLLGFARELMDKNQ